jgi:hypothetical protein
MGEFDDLLGDVVAEVPALKSEYEAAPAQPPDFEEDFFDKDKLAKFMADTMLVPLEAISDAVINRGYAAVVWHFRAAALSGDIDKARSLKMWLDWAQSHMDKPKPSAERVVNPGTQAFLPRETK